MMGKYKIFNNGLYSSMISGGNDNSKDIAKENN